MQADATHGDIPTSAEPRQTLPPWAAAAVLVAATVVAYSNSWDVPFLYDDQLDIVRNSSIQQIWPPWTPLFVQAQGRTVLHSRPVVNFSLAVNYALAGLAPRVYHATNLAIHILAGLTLLGLVRRTLRLPRLPACAGAAATPLALAVSLVWTLHPLQTESVTYVIQRFESLMGLCYWLTLYSALRSATAGSVGARRVWAFASGLACLLAMGSKEVAVSAPLAVWLFDRAFVAGSFAEAWRQRRGLYLALAGTWLPFGGLFLYSGSRATWAGFGLPVSWWEYALSQFGVILHYLRLTVWPQPLVLDYNWPVATTAAQIVPGCVVIGGLLGATLYALVRWPQWGFCGAWFFMILAPTSSVMPLADLAVEHRMYLPLASVVVLAVVGGYLLVCRLAERQPVRIAVPTRKAARKPQPAPSAAAGTVRPRRAPWRLAAECLGVGLVTVLGILTYLRNEDYRSDVWIWLDTVAKAPHNPRAHNNLALALDAQGHADDALAHYELALQLQPYYPEAHNNLGILLVQRGRIQEALPHYQQVLAFNPDDAEGHFNLGVALQKLGRDREAVSHWRQTLRLQPQQTLVLSQLAWVLATSREAEVRDGAEAVALAERALELSGGRPPALLDVLAAAYAAAGRFSEAVQTAREAAAQISASTQPELAQSLQERLRQYQAGQAFRTPLPARGG